jgi:hypothetical protein
MIGHPTEPRSKKTGASFHLIDPQNRSRPSQKNANMKTNEPTPQCLDCKRAMQLTRYIPKLGGLPELQIFMCMDCGTVAIKELTEDLEMTPH